VHGLRLELISAQLGSLPALVPVHKTSNIVRRSNDFMAMLNCAFFFFFLCMVWCIRDIWLGSPLANTEGLL
jgi:hypothetical protein